MTQGRIALIAALLLGIHLAIPAATVSAAETSEPIRAGIAVVDITPPVPWRMSGYFIERISTGVSDPLRAKAVVLRQGDASCAFVFCDLIGVTREVADEARRKANAAAGIPTEHIAIAATHSHTGPLYYGPLRDFFHKRSIEQFGNDSNESIDYPATLADRISDAIVEASEHLREVELTAGAAREDRLSFNRRFHMKNGTVQFNPGQLHPDILRPAGPTDPEVGIISLKATGSDQPFASIVAFALHLDTTGGTKYSADYPRFLEEDLQASLGKDYTLLFGAGTCGDINHIDVRTQDVRSAEEIGSALAETVSHYFEAGNGADVVAPSLAVRRAVVQAPLQEYTAAEVSEARNKLPLVGQRKLSFLDEVKACSIVDVADYESSTIPLEVQAFRVSKDVAIVTLPAEVFVELGLAIKAASPFKTTLVIELTNDCLGYIPTKKAFAEGSYETVNSRVQPGVGESLVEAAVELLKKLH